MQYKDLDIKIKYGLVPCYFILTISYVITVDYEVPKHNFSIGIYKHFKSVLMIRGHCIWFLNPLFRFSFLRFQKNPNFQTIPDK